MTNAVGGAATFRLPIPPPLSRTDAMFPAPAWRRSWNHEELLSILPPEGVRALDVGAGRNPLQVRTQDELVTVDFESEADADVVADVATTWPFDECEFDLVYMSHIVEHFYPRDRDAVLRHVYRSMKEEGLLFIRVPHRSSFNSGGWEHHTTYGLAEAVSLCHGHNPHLPMFRTVSVGASLTIDFYSGRSRHRAAAERALSRYWKLTDLALGRAVGGIPEVQFMLQKMDAETERRLRATSIGYAA
jgi:SAM-dependent methyltransferase